MTALSLHRRLIYQEAPRNAEEQPPQEVQLPEELERATRYATRFQEAIDRVLPRNADQLAKWGTSTQETFTYAGVTYRISFVHKAESAQQGDSQRRIGLVLSHQPRLDIQGEGLGSDHFLRQLMSKQIAVFRVDRQEQGEAGKSSLYQVLFDPLDLVIEIDSEESSFESTTRGKESTEAEIAEALRFVEKQLPKIALAAKIEEAS